jgi:plastocyanin
VNSRRSLLTVSMVALVAAAVAGPVAAQSPSAPAASPAMSVPAGPAITVVAKDYHFEGLPTTVPVGATLTLENQGTEYHELIVARKNDGVTKTWDELLQMSNNDAFQYITILDAEPLVAAPGETATGNIVIAQTGEYFALCFVPKGSTPGAPSPAPGESPGVPHFMLGMRQTFTGTAAGTPVGPLPSMAPMASPMGSAAP